MENLKRSWIWLAVLLFTACASARVQSDYDETVNFRKYKTYRLATPEELNPDQRAEFNLERFTDQRLREAIHENMREEGYRKDTINPDVKVFFGLTIEKRIAYQTTGYSGGYGYPYFGYGYGYGFGGLGFTTAQTVPYTYNEGTVLLSLVDENRKEVVWHASYSKTANKVTKLTRQKDMDKAIHKIFKKYPVKKK